MNYYPFHLGDYAAHTGHLEPMEDLAYRRLLDLYYLRECALPTDIQATAKLIRMRSCAADVESVLNEFFTLTDAGWVHERCDEEIAKMQDKQAKARKSAAASVNARRANAERALPEQPTDVERPLAETPTDVELPTPTPTPTPKKSVVSPLAPPADRGTRLAADWHLPDDWRMWCIEHRPDLNVDEVAEQFRDFWVAKPGKDGRKADWLATWRNWCRSQKTGPSRKPGSADDWTTRAH